MLGFFLISACSPSQQSAVDRLNDASYAWHYRRLDSTEYYARQALSLSVPPSSSFWDRSSYYADGYAEALNHLAFVYMVRMEYQRADSLLQEIISTTDNQIELLVAEVQQMRLCQRRSQNRSFYEHRELAQTHLLRITEEHSQLSERQRRRVEYAKSEMAIVTSTYYYYVGLERQSVDAMRQLNLDAIRPDTAQYLNYLYNVGAGGILTSGSSQQIQQEEMDYLYRCLNLSRRHHYVYFVAQALEGLADHISIPQLSDVEQAEVLRMAGDALQLFREYGDVYQIAGAHRTLASCYHVMGDDVHALEHLHLALSDSVINQAPDLVASIREQLSVAYSSVDDKLQSDYNRNIYIDLQEQTRQDRELEARAGLLDHAVTQLNWMILAVVIAILFLFIVLVLLSRRHRQFQEINSLDELLEQRQEEVNAASLRVEQSERRYLEQRAKVSLAMSILPLIDRILYTVQHSPLDEQYVRELTDSINEQNNLLTQWIQLRQGELTLHIESFPLQQLFDLVARGQSSFALKGVELDVRPTDVVVKADRVLTLFMLNTLADNARKFTPQGGRVTISAADQTDSVEISVNDTGCGMTEEQLANVFNHKVQQGHGFGLMNCKGIIEKYRKISQIFSVCQLQAESKQGRGSRFYFRLPKGIQRLLLFLLLPWSAATLQASPADLLSRAHVFADSAFFSNVNGSYARTLVFADSCRQCLNRHYQQKYPNGRQFMSADGQGSSVIPEIQWYHQGIETNYQIILDIRNESAVAALALHQWSLYAYNNKVYTQLFKEMSADSSLAEYCRTMQQSRQNKRIAVILLLVLLTSLVPAYYMLYYRQRLNRRLTNERQKQDLIEQTTDELHRAELESANLHVANSVLDNCLSTLKHETMYYPSRIRQLIDSGQLNSLGEVTGYYRDLYGILIQQALEPARAIHPHIRPLMLYGQRVLGDDHLLRYLFELLQVSCQQMLPAADSPVKTDVKDRHYVSYSISLSVPLGTIETLLCRQIVRDHGEATNRRGCGITVTTDSITILLPRYTDNNQ